MASTTMRERLRSAGVSAGLVSIALGLIGGCTVVDRSVRFTGRTVGLVAPSESASADPMVLQLQLAMLSDSVVAQALQLTAKPLADTADARVRQTLLQLRLDYASALWSAVSGPNPRVNAINLMFSLALERGALRRPAIAAALGPARESLAEVLVGAEEDIAPLVQAFLAPEEFEALRAAIDAEAASPVAWRGVAAVDIQGLLETADSGARAAGRSTNLLRLLGVDPLAGLDPATREIAESRQFGERLLFSLQRAPFLLRLNSELLANDVARDIDMAGIVDSLDRASRAMAEVAATAAALPDRLSAEREQLVAAVRSEADRLAGMADQYRGAFGAADAAATSIEQALQTLTTVIDRFQPNPDPARPAARPFDVNEYAHAAGAIGAAASNLTALLGQVEGTLDSSAVAKLSPHLVAALDQAEARGRRVLYLAFGLGCALIAVASLATLVTIAILRRTRAAG